MKLREFLLLFVLVFFIACGSKKKLAESSSQKNKKEVSKNGVVQKEDTRRNEGDVNDNNRVSRIEENQTDSSNNRYDDNGNRNNRESSGEIKPEHVVKTYTLTSNYTQEYIDTYASIAVSEMHAYKIPASITLAQGILESGSGRSELALKSNNHFGIKCHKGWKGSSVSHDDDAIGECFRKYKYPETSYEDHSKFLTSRSRYSKLFKLKITDYIGWAYGLKKAGYATDKKYPKKLIAIIKKYHLYNYDNNAIEDMPSVVHHSPVSVTAVSATHEVVKGDTLYSISRRYQTTVELLKEINGLRNNIINIGQELLVP